MITTRLATLTTLRAVFGTALLLVVLEVGCVKENPGYMDDPADMTTTVIDGTAQVDLAPDNGAIPDNGDTPDLPETPDLPLTPDIQVPPDLLPPVDQADVPDQPIPVDYALPDFPPLPDLPPPDKALPKPDIKVLFKIGKPCTKGSQCKTGWCVDKVCCTGPCKGKCMACHLKASPGKCSFLPNGTDLNNDCKTVDKVSTCKFDGTCNGKGGCRYYPKGTVCVAARCNGNNAMGQRLCDGGGSCLAGTQTKCFPYNCDKTTKLCYSSCTATNEITVCSGYFGCNSTSTTGTCNKSCLNHTYCNSKGKCDKGKCVKK